MFTPKIRLNLLDNTCKNNPQLPSTSRLLSKQASRSLQCYLFQGLGAGGRGQLCVCTVCDVCAEGCCDYHRLRVESFEAGYRCALVH